jgi:polyisoprenoid-binding protein YceI
MTATMIVNGLELPAPGTWAVDPHHTEVSFVGRHLGLSRTRGRFTRVDGTVHVGADPSASTIDITIDMASVESGSDRRDDSLCSPHWFDVASHPTARFRSTSVIMDGTGAAVTGDLTLKGITRPVVLDVEYLGSTEDPWGNNRAGFSATATINREDWGVANNLAFDTDRLLVSKRIQLEIDLELIRE